MNQVPDENHGRADISDTGVPVEVVRFLINVASQYNSFYEIGSRNGRVLSEIKKHTNVSVSGMEKTTDGVDAALREFDIILTLGSYPETQLEDSDIYFFWIYASLIPEWIKCFRNTRFKTAGTKYLYVASEWEHNEGKETKALRQAATEFFGAEHFREYKIPFYRGEEFREFGVFVVGKMELTDEMQLTNTQS
jgi:hypothetical protein